MLNIISLVAGDTIGVSLYTSFSNRLYIIEIFDTRDNKLNMKLTCRLINVNQSTITQYRYRLMKIPKYRY